MSKTYILSALITLLAFSIQSQESDSIYMNAGYENDVFYSMENGMVKTETRANWDIAFQTDAFSSAILINDGSGAILKTYPNGDTADWATLDTAGYSQWPAMYNHDNDWAVSAFERNSLGHPDYGWGIYNMTTHNVTGDSLFVMQLIDGAYKKVWIEKKVSAQNTYYFRYANLDGSNEQVIELDINPYTGKNYVYYSMVTDEVLDREPPKDSWDLLFTKYIAMIDGMFPYAVTGVLNNTTTGVAEYANVDPGFENWQMEDLTDTAKSVIGYDWKSFDMGTFTYKVDDSVTFYVSAHNRAIYRLKFAAFEGSSTGKIVFNKSVVSTAGVNDLEDKESPVKVFPNPVSSVLNIHAGIDESFTIRLYNAAGQRVMSKKSAGKNATVSVTGLKDGLYILQLETSNGMVTRKIAVR